MSWIWGSGGTTLFDIYSLQHVVWFIAITLILASMFKDYVWLAAIAVAIMWEIFEHWVVHNFSWFPFAGKEELINKTIGDPISNLIGFLIAMYCIKCIRNHNK